MRTPWQDRARVRSRRPFWLSPLQKGNEDLGHSGPGFVDMHPFGNVKVIVPRDRSGAEVGLGAWGWVRFRLGSRACVACVVPLSPTPRGSGALCCAHDGSAVWAAAEGGSQTEWEGFTRRRYYWYGVRAVHSRKDTEGGTE